MTSKRTILTGILAVAAVSVAYLFNPWYPPLGSVASQEPAASANVSRDDPTIAYINNESIRKSEFLPYLQDLASREQLLDWGRLENIPQEVYETALLNLAEDRLVRKIADENALTDRPELRALMEKSANRIAKQALLEQLAPQLVKEESIKQRYTELAESLEGKTEYRVRHILLQDKKEADIVYKALEERPFDELAKLFSLDEQTGLRGGDLGYVLPGSLDPEFEAVAKNLKVGETSQPFKTKFGWHIARVEDRREAKPMSYDEAQPVLRRQLQREAVQAWLQQVVANADIQTLIETARAPSREQTRVADSEQAQDSP
ncbi:MAG: peptidylprolyl isomerase [Pseudomonadota bacterium]|nr:peptidylprolyl isomerase [Pseudomonadota bacterium]